MDQDAVYSEPVRPLAQQAHSQVATVLLCQNNLIRGGIDHILSGTRFVISAEAGDQTSGALALYLIYPDQAANDVCETVTRLQDAMAFCPNSFLERPPGSLCCHSCLPSWS